MARRPPWVKSSHRPWDPPSPFREMYDPGYDGQELIDPVPGAVEGYMTPEELKRLSEFRDDLRLCL